MGVLETFLMHTMADCLNTTVHDLRSADKRRPLPDHRAIVAWTLHQMGFGCVAIGRMLNRDHTTALASIERYKDHYMCEVQFRMKANNVIRALWINI